MFASILITLALTGQAPRNEIADLVAPPERQRQLLAQIQARAGRPEPAPMRRPAARTPRTPSRYSYESSTRAAGYRAHNAQVQREVAAAAAQQQAIAAAQQRQYLMMLPYALEQRRQDINRQTDLERNEILNRALNGTSYVPAVGLRPGPVDNGNRMPLP